MEPWQFGAMIAAMLFGPAGGVVVYSKFGINGLAKSIRNTDETTKQLAASMKELDRDVNEGFTRLSEQLNGHSVSIARLEENHAAHTGWIRRLERGCIFNHAPYRDQGEP